MSFATLAGLRVVSGTVRCPSRGAWVADLTLDSSASLTGSQTLTVGDLSLVGSVVRGATYAGTSAWRMVGGAGRWGAMLGARAYRNDAGVKRSTVLADIARDAGETLELPADDVSLGTAWTRLARPAREALALAWGAEWYVDDDGTTRLGARPTGTVSAPRQVVHEEPEHGLRVLATEYPAAVRPGYTLDGRSITSVLYRLADTLRVQVWL